MVAIFGILKAGAAYVPLDVSFPPRRIAEIVDEDAQCPAVLIEHKDLAATHCAGLRADLLVFGSTGTLCALGTPSREATAGPLLTTGSDLIYVMYTSGSTGKPKGVMVAHTELLMRVAWMQEAFCCSEGDVVPQKTRLIFGISEWEIFWTLAHGATLCIVPDAQMRTPATFVDALERMGASFAFLVPSHLAALLPPMEQGLQQGRRGALRTLRHAVCCGEVLPLSTVKLFHRAVLDAAILALSEGGGDAPSCELHNLYGPTEGSMTSFGCPAATTQVLIGQPIGNTVVLLVDAELRPVPVGVVGEILFGGCIAKGYLNNPQLTDDKFVSLNGIMGAAEDDNGVPPTPTFYRTGDAAVRLPSGELAYRGRIDRQCKVRGYRIELEAVEATLKDFPALRSGARIACVPQGKGAATKLVVFVEADAGSQRDAFEGILAFARGQMPEYMVPARVEALEAMPTLASGKNDLKLLASGSMAGDVVDSNDGSHAGGGPTHAPVDSLGAVQAASTSAQSPEEARREKLVLNALRAFLMLGVNLDHFAGCNGRVCEVVVAGISEHFSSTGGGLHLGHECGVCTTAACSVTNNLLRAFGNWKTMSGFAMVTAYADAGFADAQRFGVRDVVVVLLLLLWIWVLDPLMWHLAPSWLCPELDPSWRDWAFAGSIAEGTQCGTFAWSGPRWYFNFVLVNKCLLVGLRWAPSALQCVLVLLCFLMAPPFLLCITEDSCANEAQGLESIWVQLRPWKWGIWTALIVGPSDRDGKPIADWTEFTYLVSRSYLFCSVQSFLTFHYGRPAVRWCTTAWRLLTESAAPRARVVARAAVVLLALLLLLWVEILTDSDELHHASTYTMNILGFASAGEWGEGATRLTKQWAALRALVSLGVLVCLLALAAAVGLPSRESSLVRLAGSTTLGSYIGSTYVRWHYQYYWYGILPRSGPVAEPVVLGGIVWILLSMLLLQVTLFPLFHYLLLFLVRLVLRAAALLRRCLVLRRPCATLCSAGACRRLMLPLFCLALFVWLFAQPLPLTRPVALSGSATTSATTTTTAATAVGGNGTASTPTSSPISSTLSPATAAAEEGEYVTQYVTQYDYLKDGVLVLTCMTISACVSCCFMAFAFCLSPIRAEVRKRKGTKAGASDGNAEWENESPFTRPSTFTGLPNQQPAKAYYKAIVPLALLQLVAMILTAQVLLPLGAGLTDACVALILHPFTPAEDVVNGSRSPFEALMVQILFAAAVLVAPFATTLQLGFIFHRLKKGTLPAPQGVVNTMSGLMPRKVPKEHVIVIPAYKEPDSVLTRTLESIARQTCGSEKLSVLLAMEAKDGNAESQFEQLKASFGARFKRMIMTSHTLMPGELDGKSANENHAVRELVRKHMYEHDPYTVLITITDADSVFAPRYFEQLSWVYSQQPSPERLMYHPVFDTRRNFFETNMIIAKHEAHRCASLLLLSSKHGGLKKVAMSNYSLTLGFARDIEFWTADNMPEDAHTTIKAFVYSNGSDILVPVYSVISNDLVVDMNNRYIQSKRHAWGVTEVGYVASLYQHIRFPMWAALLAARIKGELTIVPPFLMLLIPGTWQFLLAIRPLTLYFIVCTAAYFLTFEWVVEATIEWVVWTVLLPPLAPQIPPPTPSQKARLIFMNLPLVSHVLKLIGDVLFHVIARWHAACLSCRQSEIRYVTAPKGDKKMLQASGLRKKGDAALQ